MIIRSPQSDGYRTWYARPAREEARSQQEESSNSRWAEYTVYLLKDD